LIHDGPAAAIVEECSGYLDTVGCRDGYILSDGFGLMPGTPAEHIAAMVAASRRVASRSPQV
jgi:uroporphyrinogen-III decarboxylase